MKFSPQEKSFKGETDIWLTPKNVLDDLGPFDMDPCAAPEPRPWATASKMVSLPQDGLTEPWEGFIWLNPPYGPRMFEWVQRLALHGNGIALLFARTETSAFMENVFKHATGLLFLRGRLAFHYPDGKRAKNSAGAPSVLVGFGAEAFARLQNSTLAGFLVEPLVETGKFSK